MKKFRLPRKEKKSLKRGLWLYPADEKGNSLMASPRRCQKDYNSMKGGILRNIADRKRLKEGAKEQAAKLDPAIMITDEQLKEYVNDVFRKDLRSSAYNTFKMVKDNPKMISAYYNFVNAYNLYKKGESSYGNICCLSLDKAEDLLREEKRRKYRKKNK